MREIKFRAWSEYSNKLVVWERMKADDTLGGVLNGDDKKIHVMQYTGLKDKNGREIYEGDIVKFGDCSGGNGFDYYETVNVGSIKYDNETISYFFTNRDTVEMHEIDFDEVEVIGNIYENPELLEAK